MSDASPNTLVYVAYARADVARVEPVVAALRERGLHVHFNATTAHGSGGYVHESHRTLRDADALVVFVSRAAAQSHWVESETRAFQTQLARGGHRRLIPVRLDEIALPVALAPYTTVDAVDAAPATVASTLAHALGDPAAEPSAASPAVAAPATQPAPAPAPAPAPVASESPAESVYVAYARADVARVEPIVAALRAQGVAVHFDTSHAHGGGDYVQAAQQELGQASALVVFVSRAAAQSHWVESETRAFQTQLARGGHRRLIPVRLDEIALPVALAPYTTVDAVDAAPATVASTLAHYLSAQPEAPAPPAPAGASADEQVAAEQARQKARAAEWNRRWKLVQQAREREAASAAPTEPEVAAAAPAEPEAAAPAGDQLVWDGDQWAWASDQVVSRGGISEPPAPTPNAQDDTVKAPAVDRQSGMGSLGTLDWDAVEREVYRPDAESKSADNSLGSAAAEPPPAEESDVDSARGGLSAPPAPVAPPPPPPATMAPPAPQPITQPRVEAVPVVPVAPPAPAPQAPGATPAAQPTRLEQVTFTAYHPREMQPQQWQPLVVYISLDNPATLALVSAAAAERLAGKLDQFRPGRADKPAGLARGTALRIVPVMLGFEFNPAYLDVTWQEDVQQHELRMRATTARSGQAANGVVQFYQGMLLRAEVPMSVFVGHAPARLDTPDAYAQAIARAYRRVFASYSHSDMPVVESCETAARTMGDQYLRDVTLLQAGTQWDPRLIQAINDADVFQLFWSKRAAASPYVEREWRHALQLLPARPNFIRPVYWSRQIHPTPPELNALHFQPLSLSSLGWGWFRRTFYSD